MSGFFLVQVCLLSAVVASGQPFRVGTSKVSIEPGPSIFSTALAGYGLPREGRFSIAWKYVDDLPEIRTLAAEGQKLYAVSREGDVMSGAVSGGKITWKKHAGRRTITALFAGDGKLHAVDGKGKMLSTDVAEDRFAWKSMGRVPKLKGVAIMGGAFYGLGDDGLLYKSPASGRPAFSQVTDSGNAGKLAGLTADEGHLYAFNEGDSLLSGGMNGEEITWTLIGRNNGATYDLDMHHLVATDDRLYAVSSDRKLYVNEHRTRGQLSAMALAIQKGGERLLIISADLCGFEHSFTHAIREILSKEHHVPPSAILFNATHTHFAPITQEWSALGPFYSKPDAAYMRLLSEGMLRAAREALARAKPANLFFGRGSTEIGRNRRSSDNPDAPYDNTLDILVARDGDENITGMLFMTGCHPVYRNAGEESFTLSANYPAVARDRIRESTGADQVMFIQGFGGDINPRDNNHEQTGKNLAADVLTILQKDLHPVQGSITHAFDTLDLPIETWSREKIADFRNDNLPLKGNLEAERNVRWADAMLERYAKGTFPSTLPLYVQTLGIGDWKLVGLSREVVNEYGPAIRNIWPDDKVSVAGYCNDVTSYLPADWHITAGVYEGNGSFYWYGAPGTFPTGTKDLIIETIRNKR